MPWIKKNLTLVLGGLVGLILLGGSGLFLFSQYGRESEINAALEEKRSLWTSLNSVTPFPDEKNIKAVKEDAARLEKLSLELKGRLNPVEVAPVTDTFSLKLLIENTISDLRKEAEAAGVGIPNQYAFTFGKLREMPQFESNGIPKLAEQVAHISTLCRVLYDAKVHTLNTLRRPPVLRAEGGTSDYLTKRGLTNEWVVRLPYDLSFSAFTAELAEVIKGLAALKECVVIKTINVEPTTLPPSGGASPGVFPGRMMPPPMAPPGGGVGPGGMDPRYGLGGGRGENNPLGGGINDPGLRARYGLGPPGAGGAGAGGMDAGMRARYGLGGASASPPPNAYSQPGAMGGAPAPMGPSVLLDEKPLRVIIQVDIIRPRAPGETGGRSAAPRSAATAATAATEGEAAPADAPAEPEAE